MSEPPPEPGPVSDPWWETYFDQAFLRIYEPLLPPAETRREVAGIQRLLGLPRGARLLDLGCGWGRHALPLAAAGYRVTGVDLSVTLLDRARREAESAGVEVEWVRADVRFLSVGRDFDAAVSLFSSLGYWGSDAEDLRALRSARAALRPGGLFLLETMHRDHVVAHYAERDWWETEDGTTVWTEREWDAVAGVSREHLRWSRGSENGSKRHRIRVRAASEWRRLLRRAHLEPLAWYGGWEGEAFQSASEVLVVLCRAG